MQTQHTPASAAAGSAQTSPIAATAAHTSTPCDFRDRHDQAHQRFLAALAAEAAHHVKADHQTHVRPTTATTPK